MSSKNLIIYFNLIFLLVLIIENKKTINPKSGVSRINFIPFGTGVGDTQMKKNDDEYDGPLSLKANFTFFNTSYDSLWVNTNGLISFDRGVREVESPIFPNKRVVCISPFWSDIDISSTGDIYYREITDKETLQKIEYEILDVYYEFFDFQIVSGFVVTWLEVPQFKMDNKINNTFQVVLATDGKYSFTIFNYETLHWSTVSTQAGFNSGNGISYFNLPGSFENSVKNLTSLSNVASIGKWIFRTDSDHIIETGCSSDNILRLKPNNVSILGGEQVSVTGPCFYDDDSIFIIIDSNQGNKIECVFKDKHTCSFTTPKFEKNGTLPFMIVINGFINYEDILITYVDPKNSAPKLLIQGYVQSIILFGLLYLFQRKHIN